MPDHVYPEATDCRPSNRNFPGWDKPPLPEREQDHRSPSKSRAVAPDDIFGAGRLEFNETNQNRAVWRRRRNQMKPEAKYPFFKYFCKLNQT